MQLQQFFPTVLNMSLTGSTVIGLVLIARLLLKKAPKVFSYALWLVVLFRLLCPVSIASGLSLWNFVNTADLSTQGPVTTIDYTAFVAPEDSMQTSSELPVPQETTPNLTPRPDVSVEPAPKAPEPLSYVSLAWLVGIGAMLLYAIVSCIRLFRQLTGAVRLQKNISIGDHITTPFVLGFLRPRVYLPSTIGAAEQEYIIAHEQFHIKRMDHITRLLAYLALCLHWFNPLVWLAFSLSGKDMEMSCDEAVLRMYGPSIRAEYAASLLRLTTGRRSFALTPLAFSEGNTKARVINMASWKKTGIRTTVCALAVCVAVLTACGLNPTAEAHGRSNFFDTENYQYGNMQKNLPPGNFMRLNNEVLFIHYRNGKSLIHSYDLNTEEIRVYCDDPACKHGSCTAGNLNMNLEVYKGKLYGMQFARGMGTHTYPAVANGNAADVIVPANTYSFFHHADKLYIMRRDGSVMVLEEGAAEPRQIMEEYHGYWHVIFGDYMYGNTYDTFYRVDLTVEEPKEEVLVPNGGGITDGQHIYYIESESMQLYRCEMDGSDPQLLVAQPVLFASINFDDEYFYYRLYTDKKLYGNADSCDIYRFPKEDPMQIEKIVTLPISAYQVFTVPGTGKLFVTTHAPQGEDRPIYIMGTDGSDPKVLEIPEY